MTVRCSVSTPIPASAATVSTTSAAALSSLTSTAKTSIRSLSVFSVASTCTSVEIAGASVNINITSMNGISHEMRPAIRIESASSGTPIFDRIASNSSSFSISPA